MWRCVQDIARNLPHHHELTEFEDCTDFLPAAIWKVATSLCAVLFAWCGWAVRWEKKQKTLASIWAERKNHSRFLSFWCVYLLKEKFIYLSLCAKSQVQFQNTREKGVWSELWQLPTEVTDRAVMRIGGWQCFRSSLTWHIRYYWKTEIPLKTMTACGVTTRFNKQSAKAVFPLWHAKCSVVQWFKVRASTSTSPCWCSCLTQSKQLNCAAVCKAFADSVPLEWRLKPQLRIEVKQIPADLARTQCIARWRLSYPLHLRLQKENKSYSRFSLKDGFMEKCFALAFMSIFPNIFPSSHPFGYMIL